MDRVKESMTRPGKGPLAMFAAALQSTGALGDKLEEYISKAPMMLAQGAEVAELTLQCKGLVQSPEGLVSMAAILKKLPGLQQGLRSGATTQLFMEAKDAVERLWTWMLTSKQSGQVLSSMSALLSEATVVFPMEAAFQSHMLRCGELLKEAGEADLLGKLGEALAGLSESSDDPATLTSNLEKVQAQARVIGAGTGGWTAKLYAKLKAALMFVMQMFEKGELSVMTMELWELAAVTAQEAGAFLKDVAVTEPYAEIEKIIAVCRGHAQVEELLATLEQDGEKSLLQSTTSLQRAMMALDMKAPVVQNHPALKTFQEWHAKGKETVEVAKNAMLKVTTANLEDLVHALLPVSGGMQDGSVWDSQLANTATFDELMQRAHETLFMGDRNALADGILKVKKASVRADLGGSESVLGFLQ